MSGQRRVRKATEPVEPGYKYVGLAAANAALALAREGKTPENQRDLTPKHDPRRRVLCCLDGIEQLTSTYLERDYIIRKTRSVVRVLDDKREQITESQAKELTNFAEAKYEKASSLKGEILSPEESKALLSYISKKIKGKNNGECIDELDIIFRIKPLPETIIKSVQKDYIPLLTNTDLSDENLNKIIKEIMFVLREITPRRDDKDKYPKTATLEEINWLTLKSNIIRNRFAELGKIDCAKELKERYKGGTNEEYKRR